MNRIVQIKIVVDSNFDSLHWIRHIVLKNLSFNLDYAPAKTIKYLFYFHFFFKGHFDFFNLISDLGPAAPKTFMKNLHTVLKTFFSTNFWYEIFFSTWQRRVLCCYIIHKEHIDLPHLDDKNACIRQSSNMRFYCKFIVSPLNHG